MKLRTIVHGVALIAVLGFISAGQVARADDCDDEQDELKKLIERVINYNANPRGIGPVCAATGQILGVTKAAREIAAECYDDGKKRTAILEEYDKGIQEDQRSVQVSGPDFRTLVAGASAIRARQSDGREACGKRTMSAVARWWRVSP
jgi:hypothetical protein